MMHDKEQKKSYISLKFLTRWYYIITVTPYTMKQGYKTYI